MNGTIEAAFIGRLGGDPEARTSQAGKRASACLIVLVRNNYPNAAAQRSFQEVA